MTHSTQNGHRLDAVGVPDVQFDCTVKDSREWKAWRVSCSVWNEQCLWGGGGGGRLSR